MRSRIRRSLLFGSELAVQSIILLNTGEPVSAKPCQIGTVFKTQPAKIIGALTPRWCCHRLHVKLDLDRHSGQRAQFFDKVDRGSRVDGHGNPGLIKPLEALSRC